MPKVLTPKKLIAIIERHGFRLARSKGSHFIFVHPVTKRRVIIPFHTKDLPRGTFHEILKKADISREEL